MPLCAATVAGLLCASTTNASATPAAESSESSWVWNYTDQILTAGEFHKQQGVRTSNITFGGSTEDPAPAPGQGYAIPFHRETWSTARTYTWGRVCYDHLWWNLLREGDTRFTWDDMYIFALDDGQGGKKLVANPEGAYVNIRMFATDTC